ncbi:MAG: pitrilysin family protein [Candidatus Aureabacteria bacterium]|nr:pitrilysin family protein [Candidatus Auribacterota bacterium]
MRIWNALFFAALLLSSSAESEVPLRLDVKEHHLPNGLTLLMLEHHEAPVVSCSVFYRVGSVDEEVGSTGISHLLEHMMFKGTRLVGTKDFSREEPLLRKIDALHARIREKESGAVSGTDSSVTMMKQDLARVERDADALKIENELWKIYTQNGAVGLNASTGRDYTQYVCSLPSNRLELWMWLESDRMQNAVFREFYRERDVVLEERRLRIDDSPEGTFDEQLFATSFIAHPYRWPVIGWKSDIANISPGMLESFYRRSYAPNNAIIVIVGDIQTPQVIGLAERYFGPVPAGPQLPPVVTREPGQRGKREAILKLPASPKISLAFHKPGVGDEDDIALDVLDNILSSGRTSRLYRHLVEETQVAVSVSCDNNTMKYPSLFVFEAIPRQPRTCSDVEGALFKEIETLAKEPVSEWELQKSRNQVEANFVRGLESTSDLASLIGTYASIYSWEYINTYIPKVRAITAPDLIRVTKKYLREENCTKMEMEHAPSAGEGHP